MSLILDFVLLVLSLRVTIALVSEDVSYVSTSGTKILLTDIFLHLQNISFDALPHLIFEQRDEILKSQHAYVNITDLAPKAHNFCKYSQCTTVRTGNGYTFAFNKKSGWLVCAWGPALQLRQLSSHLYPGILVNLAIKESPTIVENVTNGETTDRVSYRLPVIKKHQSNNQLRPSLMKQSSPRTSSPCEKVINFRIRVHVEKSFFEVYENDKKKTRHVLRGLQEHLKGLFKNICVNVIIMLDSIMGREILPKANDLRECALTPGCSTASLILKEISKITSGRPGFLSAVEVLLIWPNAQFSTLAGATYRRSVCDKERNVAVVFGEDAGALAHELAHLIGASHDDTGVMKSVIDKDEPLEFSNKSKSEIERFLWKDASSFCLHLFGFKKNVGVSEWSQAAFAGQALVIFRSKRIMSLKFPQFYNDSSIFQEYWFNRGIPCRTSYVNKTIEFNRTKTFESGILRKISFFNFSGTRLHDIAFGRSNSDSPYVQMFVSYFRGAQPMYRVGFGFRRDSGSPPHSWSKEIAMPPINRYLSVQSSSIAIGSIRSADSIDLIHLVFTKAVRYVKASYRIGFNISPTGHVRGGWSEFIPIDGYVGYKAGRSSVSIADIDGNGRPDLLVNQFMSLLTASLDPELGFLRIGRDLDTDGRPIRGWTGVFTFQQHFYHQGDVIFDKKCKSSLVSAGQVGLIQTDKKMYFGRNEIKKEFVKSAKVRGPLPDTFDGCVECFSTLSHVNQCKERVEICAARVDEVHIRLSRNPSLPTELRVTNNEPQHVGNNANFFFAYSTTRDGLDVEINANNRSAFCIGFDYFLKVYSDHCDAIDRERVIAKGIEILFLRELNSISSKRIIVISSSSIFEDPVATNGVNNDQVVAQFELIVKSKSYAKTVKKAFRTLSRRPSMSDTYSKLRLEQRRRGKHLYMKIDILKEGFTAE